MRAVLALGGNALLRRGEPLEVSVQRRNVERAVRPIAEIACQHQLILTHGNGPQVGLLALQAESLGEVAPPPLDVLGAESQGMIGYMLEQALASVLPELQIAALLTQVVVADDDPAFASPTKPIGPTYASATAERFRAERGWEIAETTGGWRRVVASPEPRRILGLEVVRRLVDAGVLVICAGGGGVPVIERGGGFVGVEAVIDKDLTSALLAQALGAELLVLLTDVAGVYRHWPAGDDSPLGRTTPDELRTLRARAGSMGPKIEAVCRFVEATGGRAAVGTLEEAEGLVAGTHGTQVEPSVRAAGSG